MPRVRKLNKYIKNKTFSRLDHQIAEEGVKQMLNTPIIHYKIKTTFRT